MSSAVANTSGGGGGHLSLMSCVRESSPQESVAEMEAERNGTSKKTFWKFTRWFKRRSNKVAEEINSTIESLDQQSTKEVVRCRSTNKLFEAEEPSARRKSGTMHPGLSVSHDSIFQSPQSGSDLELEAAQSSSSLYIHQPTQTELRLHSELSERLRLRRGRGDTSEDDEGLPHSPCNSPTATESLFDKVPIKDHATKSHSTCSDGSLLSMGSSDTEEDSVGLHSSRHSSKVSLHEKKLAEQDSDLEIGSTSVSSPLNHAAAHHRVAVKPKRTHGAPRRIKMQQLTGTTLPTTPEVNEELPANRTLTPETNDEMLNELNTSMSMSESRIQISKETRLKCSSLPPGLARPEDMNKLSRSQSSVGSKSQNPLEENEEEKNGKSHSIFGRFFPRRSGRKKKSGKPETEPIIVTSSTEILTESFSTNVSRSSQKPTPMPRTGPAARQRVQPIDIPASPEIKTRLSNQNAPKASPEKLTGTSPLHQELQNHFRNHMFTEAKPPRPPIESPQSPKLSRPNTFEVIKHFETREEYKARHFETKEEFKHKAKFTGLSSLQQRVMHHNDDTDEVSFKSLTDLPSNEVIERKPVTKSHSFKTGKTPRDNNRNSDDIKQNLFRFISQECKMESKNQAEEEREMKSKNQQTSDSNESLESLNSARTSSTEFLDSLTPNNDVTVCGPSHTAVISVSTNSETEDSNSKSTFVKNECENVITEEKSEKYKQQMIEHRNEDEIFIKERNVQEQTIVKEQQTSVTKIQVKQISNAKRAVPEFLNIHLNKVDPKPAKNVVVLMANLHSPTKLNDFEEEDKEEFSSPKLDFRRRRFSREEIEIFEKDQSPDDNKKIPVGGIVSSPSPPISNRFIKNYSIENSHFQYPSVRKSSDDSSKIKSSLRSKSCSLEVVDCLKKSPEEADKSLQSSLDKLDCTKSEISNSSRTSSASSLQNSVASDGVTYRRKSLGKQKKDDEPELMKVFARRSLKIKDDDQGILQEEIEKFKKEEAQTDTVLSKSRDSDKENQLDSPIERNNKFPLRDKDPNRLPEIEKNKDPLVESKIVVLPIKETKETEKIKDTNLQTEQMPDFVLRKQFNNKYSAFPRSTSLNLPKNQEPVQDKIQKHSSFAENKSKTEKIETCSKNNWNIKKQEIEMKEEIIKSIVHSEVIHDISPKNDFVNEDFPTLPRNFIQRKAEWEKRAQEALKKKAP